MDAPSKPLAADLSPAESKKWIGRLLIAVILGAAVWNFVASLTNAVVVPGLARVMEADPQSPLYLGKGDFNFPGFFAAILELCLALIAALVVNSWAQRRPKAIRRKVSSATPAASLSIAAAPPAARTSASLPVREPVSQSQQPTPPVVPRPPAAELATSVPAAAQGPRPNPSLRNPKNRRSQRLPKRFTTTWWASQLIRTNNHSRQ